MSYNFGEIIKNYIRCFKEPSQAAIQGFPPTSLQVVTANFPHSGGKCASCRHHFHSPDLLARWRGEGGVICELMPFDNESSDWAYIQDEDGQWCFNPLLFRQHLPNSYWRVYIIKRGYKREPEPAASPQLTTLHSTGNTSV
jgi:hypothetical protein